MTTVDEIISAILGATLRIEDVRAIRNALPDCRGQRVRATHCKRGHERTPENVGANNDCRLCHRERGRLRPKGPKCRYCDAKAMAGEQYCEIHIRWKPRGGTR